MQGDRIILLAPIIDMYLRTSCAPKVMAFTMVPLENGRTKVEKGDVLLLLGMSLLYYESILLSPLTEGIYRRAARSDPSQDSYP